eukprot:TRINITY_DN6776_c0_g2_i4.p1 TRINITY_DN6776_c0_g2~~TRINITY_DN6776_c0_g2_i4.p1  ORF type:complete len:306 (-),score=-17.65 TRINITY_DN6776_c0_g2_i4:220-1137(-)
MKRKIVDESFLYSTIHYSKGTQVQKRQSDGQVVPQVTFILITSLQPPIVSFTSAVQQSLLHKIISQTTLQIPSLNFQFIILPFVFIIRLKTIILTKIQMFTSQTCKSRNLILVQQCSSKRTTNTQVSVKHLTPFFDNIAFTGISINQVYPNQYGSSRAESKMMQKLEDRVDLTHRVAELPTVSNPNGVLLNKYNFQKYACIVGRRVYDFKRRYQLEFLFNLILKLMLRYQYIQQLLSLTDIRHYVTKLLKCPLSKKQSKSTKFNFALFRFFNMLSTLKSLNKSLQEIFCVFIVQSGKNNNSLYLN